MFASSHQVCTCHSLCLACLVKNLHFTFMPRNTLKIAHSISSCQAKVCVCVCHSTSALLRSLTTESALIWNAVMCQPTSFKLLSMMACGCPTR